MLSPKKPAAVRKVAKPKKVARPKKVAAKRSLVHKDRIERTTKVPRGMETPSGAWSSMHQDMLDGRRDAMMGAIRSVMQLTDRILSGEPVTVRLIDPSLRAQRGEESWTDFGGVPAWTDGTTIHLNKEMMDDMYANGQDLQDFAVLFGGTNYHELAHILFTPRKNSPFFGLLEAKRQAHGDAYFQIWNMMEDCRIETIYTTKYRAVRYYFNMAILKWLLMDVSGYDRLYPFLMGRKYLPLKIRRKFRKLFTKKFNEADTKELEQFMDRYIVCDPNQEPIGAIAIVDEFYNVCLAMGLLNMPTYGCTTTAHAKNPRGLSGHAQSAGKTPEKVQDQIDSEEKENEPEDESEDESEVDSDTGDSDSESSGGSSDSDDGTESSSDGVGSAGGGDTDDDDDVGGGHAEDNDGPGGGVAAGSPDNFPTSGGKSNESLEKALRKLLEGEYQAIIVNEQFIKDVTETVKAISARMDGVDVGQEYKNFKQGSAPEECVKISKRIVREMGELHTDLDATHLKDEAHGRIDVSRVIRNMADESVTDVFQRFDEGQEDAATTEVVIIVDLSSSMTPNIYPTSEALWILKSAFDQCNIPTTVLGFSDWNVILYKPTEKLRGSSMKYFNVWSCTSPLDSCKRAHHVLVNSQASNKLFIAITDGLWSQTPESNMVIGSMNKQGIHTMIFNMMPKSGSQPLELHECQVGKDIHDPMEMVDLMRKVVRSIMQQITRV